MRWSDLFDKPERLAIELSPLGVNSDVLVLDIRDVPELHERTQLLEAEGNFAALRLLALQWFGDKVHPQPKERRDWPGYGRTKDWGRLPAFGGDEIPGTPLPQARPSLPNETQLNSYSHASLQKAVKSFKGDGTRGDVERGAKLPTQDARRVRLMLGVDLFRLNRDKKLLVDERVARKGSRFVLRYLDEGGTRWLDPNVELRGR